MGKEEEISTTQLFEKLASEPPDSTYVLRLYVAGNTARSVQAITNIRKVCETSLNGRYKLEVIDIYQQTGLAKGEQIIAVPTLIKYLPLPLKKVVGDLSKTEKVLYGLDLRKLDEDSPDEPKKSNS